MLRSVNDWKLSKKILVAFGCIAALMVALGATGLVSNNVISGSARAIYEEDMTSVKAGTDIYRRVWQYRLQMYTHITALNDAERAGVEEQVDRNKADMLAQLEVYRRLAGESEMAEVNKLEQALLNLHRVNDQILQMSRAGRTDEALRRLKAERPVSDAALSQAEEMVGVTERFAQVNAERAQSTASLAFLFSGLLMLAALGLLGFIWATLTRTVAKPMNDLSKATTDLANGREAIVPSRDRKDELGEIAQAVELFRQAAVARAEADARLAAEQQVVTASLEQSLDALSKGDLTAEVKADFPPAYERLKTNFNSALQSLRDLIGSVMESAQNLRTGSSEIAQASEDLARRTESNAASLEETSAALTQIDGRIKATAEAAGRTVVRADEAISTVSDGRSIADEAVQAMSRVRESAKGIDEVIEGVDKIAFQTRVLAMNAAVEAGRAGDAGRGFAVVADLVSALAMRAEEEAKRARDQLTVTQTDIVTAVEAVTKIDGALTDISSGVGEVHELLGNMAQDNQAQATAITQISSAVNQMDQSTQQNAAMVEETSAAARNLNVEAEGLADKASQFRIDDGKPSRAAAKAAPAKKTNGYVSPVKALPVAATAKANGNGALVSADSGDWKDF